MPLNEILSGVSLAVTLITTLVALSVKASVSEWRNEALQERNQDKEDLRNWIDAKFLPSREADARLTRMENNHTELVRRVDENERRLRRVEVRRGRDVQDE